MTALTGTPEVRAVTNLQTDTITSSECTLPLFSRRRVKISFCPELSRGNQILLELPLTWILWINCLCCREQPRRHKRGAAKERIRATLSGWQRGKHPLRRLSVFSQCPFLSRLMLNGAGKVYFRSIRSFFKWLFLLFLADHISWFPSPAISVSK